jgi:hypothetical protein
MLSTGEVALIDETNKSSLEPRATGPTLRATELLTWLYLAETESTLESDASAQRIYEPRCL